MHTFTADSQTLWDNVLDQIPLNPNAKYLVISPKRGTNLKCLAERVGKENITIVESSRLESNQLKLEGYHVIKEDEIEWLRTTDMKFDCVLCNPPYKKKMWVNFLDVCVDITTNHLAFITPDATKRFTPFGDRVRDLYTRAGVHTINDCSEYFDVESGDISYFICSKETTEPYDFNGNTIESSLFGKVCTGGSFAIRGNLKARSIQTSDTQNDAYPIPGIFNLGTDGVTIKYVSREDHKPNRRHVDALKGSFLILNRFFAKNESSPVHRVEQIENTFFGDNVIGFKINADETVEGFKSVYESKLYKKILSLKRGKSFDTQATMISSLKRLDLSKVWTDQELYDHFNLTNEEIKYVENT